MMKNTVFQGGAFTAKEIAQLDQFLISENVPEESMDMSMMDGFLTAVLSGPNLIMPSSALPWIWDSKHGKDAPRFSSTKEFQTITSLILRYWNLVSNRLAHHLNQYKPLLLESRIGDECIPIIDEWCIGYAIGIAIDQSAWEPLLKHHPEWFATIKLYGTESGWAELASLKFDIVQHQKHADSLADSVQKIYYYWLAQRKSSVNFEEFPSALMPQMNTVKSQPKIGRNEPCPCGSDKKYKHCHLGKIENEIDDCNYQVINSPLNQSVTLDGVKVEIYIYKGSDDPGWLLEIVDEFNNSTCWNDTFPTDQAAFDEAMNTIDNEGIAAVIGEPPTSIARH